MRLLATLIVACRSTSSQPSDDFNEFLPLLETCSISWRSGACHPHILASSCIAPSLLGVASCWALRRRTGTAWQGQAYFSGSAR